ncbi:hypothetical protein [Xanthobacter aminoxidans]|uniref:hypothetical protein n=1 Tax=Xanthobacter aminoxidans TaxID=186280 RepID=UPI00372B7391
MYKSETFQLFERAIEERKQIVCMYQGYPREICPHAVGWSDNGEQALSFQFAGDSSKGLPPGGQWRCFELNQVQDAYLRDGPWYTGDSHKKPQKCVKDVALEVAY